MKPKKSTVATAGRARVLADAPPLAAPPAPPEHLSEDLELNWKIISLLQEDGRMAFSTIADKVGVSEGTVRNRVKQLRDDNVMAVAATVIPEAFGYAWNSTTFLQLSGEADVDAVAHRFAELAEVYYVVHLSGRWQLGIASYHRDREHFREFLTEHCYGRAEIAAVEANVNLKVYKMKLRWQAVPF